MRGLQLERFLSEQRRLSALALIPFINAGDPSLALSRELLRALAASGVRG